jgi:hypothetical protein
MISARAIAKTSLRSTEEYVTLLQEVFYVTNKRCGRRKKAMGMKEYGSGNSLAVELISYLP